jgi:hypothetical protein
MRNAWPTSSRLHLKRTHVAKRAACLRSWLTTLVGGQRLTVRIDAVLFSDLVDGDTARTKRMRPAIRVNDFETLRFRV